MIKKRCMTRAGPRCSNSVGALAMPTNTEWILSGYTNSLSERRPANRQNAYFHYYREHG